MELATYSKCRIYTNLSVHNPRAVLERIIKDSLGGGGDFHAGDNTDFIAAENRES